MLAGFYDQFLTIFPRARVIYSSTPYYAVRVAIRQRIGFHEIQGVHEGSEISRFLNRDFKFQIESVMIGAQASQGTPRVRGGYGWAVAGRGGPWEAIGGAPNESLGVAFAFAGGAGGGEQSPQWCTRKRTRIKNPHSKPFSTMRGNQP